MPDVSSDICSDALGRLGEDIYIESLDVDTSAEGKGCRLLYPVCKRLLLESAPWGFATRRQVLAADDALARTGWQYAYRLPPTMVKFLGFTESARWPRKDQETQYKIEGDDTSRILLTDAPAPEIRFIIEPPDSLMSPSFREALTLLIAFRVGQRLKANPALMQRVMAEAQFAWEEAKAIDAEGEELGVEPASSFTAHFGSGLSDEVL
jgi:hypothetical protein